MDKKEFYRMLDDSLYYWYGKEIPRKIRKRYYHEIKYLQESEYQNEVIAFVELLKTMKLCEKRYEIVGTVPHSFLFYILGLSQMCPLPSHYYCLKCNRVLFVEGVEFGIDLPVCICECGAKMYGEGFDLIEEMFWEKEGLDLRICVDETDYEWVKKWLQQNERMQGKKNLEEKIGIQNIRKRYSIGNIVVICETDMQPRLGVTKKEDVIRNKDIILQNYNLLLECTNEVKTKPKNFYELVRIYAFFSITYAKGSVDYISEENYLDDDMKNVLLEELYDGNIYKAPVFLEEGLQVKEWKVGGYEFLIMFTRAIAKFALDEICEKMQNLFQKGGEM